MVHEHLTSRKELEWWEGRDGQFFEVALDDANIGRITLVTHFQRSSPWRYDVSKLDRMLTQVECNYCAYRAADGAVLETNDFGSALVFVHGGRERIQSIIWGMMADKWEETEAWLVRDD